MRISVPRRRKGSNSGLLLGFSARAGRRQHGMRWARPAWRHDRKARIHHRARARTAFRPRGGGLRRQPADALGRHQAARGYRSGCSWCSAARASRASRRRASACSTGRGASSATPARMRQEIDALKHGLAGHIRIAAIPTALAMVAMITTPFRAQPSRCQLHHSLAELDRGLGSARESGGGCRADLSRQRAARAGCRPCRSIARSTGCLPPPTARSAIATGHLGRGRQGAALPADARHAEPPHHRPAAEGRPGPRSRRRSSRTRSSCCSPMCAPAAGRASCRRSSPRSSA